MHYFSSTWLIYLGMASLWTTVFSLSQKPGLRGLRNLGLLGCFLIGVLMIFMIPWRMALATWCVPGVASGLVYFLHELWVYFKTKDKTLVSKPSPMALVHGLILWPIMLPEAIENLLAELGFLNSKTTIDRNNP